MGNSIALKSRAVFNEETNQFHDFGQINSICLKPSFFICSNIVSFIRLLWGKKLNNILNKPNTTLSKIQIILVFHPIHPELQPPPFLLGLIQMVLTYVSFPSPQVCFIFSVHSLTIQMSITWYIVLNLLPNTRGEGSGEYEWNKPDQELKTLEVGWWVHGHLFSYSVLLYAFEILHI